MIYVIKIHNQAESANAGNFSYLNRIEKYTINPDKTTRYTITPDIEHATTFNDSVDLFDDVVRRMNFHEIYRPEKIKLYDIDELVNL